MRLVDFPSGKTIALDTNCLLYHFAGTHQSCALLLERAYRGTVRVVIPGIVISELHHRLMVMDAMERYGQPPRTIPSFLKHHPEVIQTLHRAREAMEQLSVFRLTILSVTPTILMHASRLSYELGLLTNDGILVATMREHALTHLASNDRDFARVPDLVVWAP